MAKSSVVVGRVGITVELFAQPFGPGEWPSTSHFAESCMA